ncbi:hypothetical protein Avbf_17399, partial [Armadillidium vulgare]
FKRVDLNWKFHNLLHNRTIFALKLGYRESKRGIRELMEFVNKSLSISTLLIKNASLSDSGQYVCRISVLNLFESNVKNIKVEENIVQFVKFKNKNDSMVHKKIVNDGDDFLWDMQFEGYPRNLIYTFYNPYGDLFLHKDKRASASYVYEEGKLSLSIKRVTVEDFGNYSVRLEAPNESFDENYVMLVVNGIPKAQFSEIPSILPADKNFTITLFILSFNLSYPEPDVFCFQGSHCSIGIVELTEENFDVSQEPIPIEQCDP